MAICDVTLELGNGLLWQCRLSSDGHPAASASHPILFIEREPYGPLDVLDGVRVGSLPVSFVEGESGLFEAWLWRCREVSALFGQVRR